MRLKTLGGLKLEPDVFHRPKPLLLLAYLAVEGAKEKRHLQELFWPDAAAQGSSMRMAISQARKVSAQLLSSDEHTLSTGVENDFAELHKAIRERDAQKLEALYQGEFLQGFSLLDWSAELEEWVYSTREFVAARVRATFIGMAEAEAGKGSFAEGVQWAEKAYLLPKEAPEPEDLERLYPLLLAGNSPLSNEIRRQAKEYGIELNLGPEEARARYFSAAAPGSHEPQATPHNLPRSKTSFVGRDPEMVELAQMLGRPEVRLITLLGPGGIGKTRLALQLASSQLQEDGFWGGIYFVALETVSETGQIPLAIAQTLAVAVKGNPLEAVKVGIGHKRVLLVLDNFEHLVDGALTVSELLEACPNLSIVATSRERLNLEEEFALSVPGLHLPEDGKLSLAGAEYSDAIRLFVQRAKRARLEFNLTDKTLPQVLAICRYVGGSPLGIELAAVWLRSLPIAAVAQEIGRILDDGLETPLRNSAERHHSLRAVFEHSWKLLKPKEQLTLRRLTVFVDGFSREAASQVCEATIPLLTSLVDKSLLRLTPEGRYDFHPLLHQYAAEKLAEAPEEKSRTRAKHAHYFLALIEASERAGVQARIQCGKDEEENLVAALTWSQEGDEALLGMRLACGIAQFWQTHGYYEKATGWLKTVLAHPGAASPTRERLTAVLMTSQVVNLAGDFVLALDYAQEGLALSQVLNLDDQTALALFHLARASVNLKDLDGARSHGEATLELAQKLGNLKLAAQTLIILANIHFELQQYDQARTRLEESAALVRKPGFGLDLMASLNFLGVVEWLTGNPKAAKRHLEEGLAVAQELSLPRQACLFRSNLAGVMQDLGDLHSAQTLATVALEYRWSQQDKFGLAYSLEGMANLAVAQGNPRRAMRLWGAAQRLLEETGTSLSALWRARHERFVLTAKSQLSGVDFESGRKEGHTMGLEQAVRYAMEQEPEEPAGAERSRRREKTKPAFGNAADGAVKPRP